MNEVSLATQALTQDDMSVKICDTELTVMRYEGVPVITLAMMDRLHGRPEGTARKRFNGHISKLREGEDYFKITASAIRTQFQNFISKHSGHKDFTLITESGYLLLAKSFTDDLAWDVQRQLVKSYFKLAQMKKNAHLNQSSFEVEMFLRMADLEQAIVRLSGQFDEKLTVKRHPKTQKYSDLNRFKLGVGLHNLRQKDTVSIMAFQMMNSQMIR